MRPGQEFCEQHVTMPMLVRLSELLQEFTLLEFVERLPELLLCVHDNGAIPGYRLLKRFSGDQEKPDAVVARLHRDLVAAIKEYE